MSRLTLIAILLLPISLIPRAAAQEPTSSAERAKHLDHMREVAGRIRVLADPQRAESAVKLGREPVLRYADNTRQTYESSLWIWTNGGRPAAILAVEYYDPKDAKGPRWLYEIASLSTQRIAAELEDNFRWTAKEPGLKLLPLPDAPPPAGKEARRLAQMKELRGRFTAFENATFSGRIELRPMATPLLRYADAEAGLIDGAIFALANGTNPEVLLALEAHTAEDKASWRYALVQMSGEPVTVQLDGKEIWKHEGAEPPAVRASYINGWIATKKEQK